MGYRNPLGVSLDEYRGSKISWIYNKIYRDCRAYHLSNILVEFHK